MENKNQRIEELVNELNKASYAYYNDSKEIMPNYEWDAKFDELKKLEDETGYILYNSPTMNAGIEESDGQKEEHEFPALSLSKSKDIHVLEKWAGNRPIWLSWKLDGLTLVATYDNGKLTKLMTRGNGKIGKNITFLAKYIHNLPLSIQEKGHMVARGEGIISYTDFNKVNDLMDNEEDMYANPRNLSCGTLNLDKTRGKEVGERGVTFVPFTLVYCEKEINKWGERMDYLETLGFKCVDRELTDAENLHSVIEKWTQKAANGFDIPVDGLVISYDDTKYANTGTITNHHAERAGMAFKWEDEVADTILESIEWSCSMNSINPVAIFKPVMLAGTEVKRASLCNISEMKRLGIGANGKTKLGIIKANMIIPKCISADADGTKFNIPDKCPVCGHATKIVMSGTSTRTEVLKCTNKNCAAKQLRKYIRFVCKDGMDIDGMSEKTIMRFINEGIISNVTDIFKIERHKDKIITMDGFGIKSYENIIAAVKKSQENTGHAAFLYSLSIPMFGKDATKRILSAIGSKGFEERVNNKQEFDDIEGIGPKISESIVKWFSDKENMDLYNNLKDLLNIKPVDIVSDTEGKCKGLTFVVTGDVVTYNNRNELKAYIESQGGKVTGSVSKKTDYLINNDAASPSSKNKKAAELGITVITEDEFNAMFC